ncbi:unnamed protein product [Durusdinium trenchii]|uniref:Uncharacterized protein n=1 Tax=Durusdinium trenchii TaxID=1381693 RepID=A0ABP0NU04_9DINO
MPATNPLGSAASESACPVRAGGDDTRLVAVDGNGTLLRGDGGVSDDTCSVLMRVEAQGIPVVLATGRPFEKAKATLERAGLRHYVLTENGARAIRIADGQAVWETWLEGAEVAKTLRQLKEAMPSVFFAQLTAAEGLIEEKHPWLEDEEQRQAAEKIFRRKVPDVVQDVEKGCKCAKTYVHLPEALDFGEAMKQVKAVVGEAWEVREIKQLLPKMRNCCEVQSSRVNKADGLRNLCQVAGIPLENVWAFGDDANDVRMLSEVGWGVRMANHLPALAGIGHDTTEHTNEEDGVAKYLEKHLLKSSSET